MSLKRRAINIFMVLVMLSSLASAGVIPERLLPGEVQTQVAQANTGLTIHFKKPTNWGTPQLYYYGATPATVPVPTWNTAPTMTSEGNGWFVYTIPGASSAIVIFKDSVNMIPGPQKPGFTRTQESWYDSSTGLWSTSAVNSDTIAPTAPTNLIATQVMHNTLTLSWGASSDNVAVTGYEVWQNNAKLADVIETTYNVTGLSVDTGYQFKVRARDAAGNVSISSNEVAVSTESTATKYTFSWDNATVYYAMIGRFFNGNTSNDNSYGRPRVDSKGKNIGTFHGGDVKGLTMKLNEGYFTDLGVNAICITAPYEQIHGWVSGGNLGDFALYAYQGYYPLDWTAIDKNVGTIEEFREFVDKAHSLGIRVVMEVVLNHVGYGTLKDMSAYGGFGGSDAIQYGGDWQPPQGGSFSLMHGIVDYRSQGSWDGWWKDWVRAGLPGYTPAPPLSQDEIRGQVGDLADVRTDLTTSVGLPPILINKWNKEASGFTAWNLPKSADLRKNQNVAPADYLIRWLAAWVEEFGIDGFRADAAKHVELFRWKQLEDESDLALKRWRANNPTKPGAKWTDDFWMTAEVFGLGVGKNNYHTGGGFDSTINFAFQSVPNNMAGIESTFSSYANQINSDPSWNVLNYISSHDTSLYDRNNLFNAATALLLAPGAAQIFYGDETGRPFGDTGSDKDQGTRSAMNWNNYSAGLLMHWRKLGQFRKNHVSVGAGAHKKIGDGPYHFSRIYSENGINDKVVVALGGSGQITLNVAGVFADGTKVRDFYTGREAIVTAGKVAIQAGSNAVSLIEEVEGVVEPPLPTGGLKVHFKKPVDWGTPQIYYHITTPAIAPGVTWASSPLMSPEKNDWFVYEIFGATAATVVFKDSLSVKQIPAPQQPGFVRTEEGWYDGTKWSSTLPTDGITNPELGDRIAPNAPGNLIASNISQRSLTLTWGASADNVGVTGYGIYQNGNLLTTINGSLTSYIVNGLNAATSYSFNIRANDAAGNISPSSNMVNVTTLGVPDTQAPSAPSNLRAVDVTSTTLTLLWSPSFDNVEVTDYEIYLDSQFFAYVGSNETRCEVFGLDPNVAYRFTVKAVDKKENISAESNTIIIKTPALRDSQSPTVPRNLRSTNIQPKSIVLTWGASTDNIGVTAYDLYQGTSLITSVSGSTSQYSVTGLNSSTSYSFFVRARDAAGNLSSSSNTLTVRTLDLPDTIPPTAPRNLMAQNVGTTSMTISWDPSSDNRGVTGYDIYLDNKWLTMTSGDVTQYWVTGLTPNIRYTFVVRARDRARNASVMSNILYIRTLLPRDTQPPSVPTGLKISQTDTTALRLTWSPSADNRGVAGYVVYLNDKVVATRAAQKLGYTSALTRLDLANLPHGSHRLQVRAFDAANNQSKLSAAIHSPKTILVTSRKLYVNGKLINLGPGFELTMTRGEWMVPYKPFFAALGFKSKWLPGNKMVEAKSGDEKYTIRLLDNVKSMQFQDNSNKELTSVLLDVAPTIKNNQLMIPIKAIASKSGYIFSAR